MNKRLVFLDAALLIVFVLGIMKLREDWQAFVPAHQVSAIQPQPESFPPLPVGAAASSQDGAEWTEIPSRNPFSFDRSDIMIPKREVETGIQLGPKPILFGTISMGQGPVALLASGRPGSASKGYKVGEAIDGWTIVQIDKKSVVVEASGVRQTVILDPTIVLSQAPPPTATPQPYNPPSQTVTPAATPQSTDEYEIRETPFGPMKVPKKKQ